MRMWCPRCGKVYEAREVPQDKRCPDPLCIGEKLVSYAGQDQPAAAQEEKLDTLEGLCLLVCDASFSMDQPAFPNPPPGIERTSSATHPKEQTKLQVVAWAVQQGIMELANSEDRITKPGNGFIGIIAFGARAEFIRDREGHPFLLSVSEIEAKYGFGLGDYLFDCFYNDKAGIDRNHTDLNAALQLSRAVYNAAVAEDLRAFDQRRSVHLLRQKDIIKFDTKEPINVPNVRVLLYSDGRHNPEKASQVVNPFQELQIPPLMTAFIGNADKESWTGADQLEALATICPEHGENAYFLIDTPGRYAILRKLFRMASGNSGFCWECLKKVIRSSGMEASPRG